MWEMHIKMQRQVEMFTQLLETNLAKDEGTTVIKV
jgi:hypothetical protein